MTTAAAPTRTLPKRRTAPSPDFAKLVLFINAALPTAFLFADARFHHLGPNPVNAALHITGILALLMLILCLAVTPLRKITNYNFLSHFRRSLGLFAFYYACLHFFIYLVWDRQLNLPNALSDLFYSKRNIVGFIALLMMVPLAITSTNASIKRMGAAAWKRLHRLVYPSAALGVLHYYWALKANRALPLAFAAVLAVFLAYRLFAAFPKSAPRKAPPIAA